MRKIRIYFSLLSLFLVFAATLNLAGCTVKEAGGAKEIEAMNLTKDIEPNKVKAAEDLKSHSVTVTDFAIRLFRSGNDNEKNTLISPLSVLCALAMTANGAEGETKEQMESVLGMPADKLNLYLHTYMSALTSNEKYKLDLANSVWFTDDERFTVDADFIQTSADYYGADIFRAPFDKQTCKDVNNWVKENTDGMIPEILNEIPKDAVMYLINALAFEAEWAEPYFKHQVKDGKFTKSDGTKQSAKFMYGEENKYLEDEKASGFVKDYYGGKYAFVALLPNEGVSLSEYVASLDASALNTLLESPEYTTVKTKIPKFETEYSVEMSDILSAMGMPKAFSESTAEFGGLGRSTAGNVFISRVVHKTFISVAEKGTKAGAATLVEMSDGALIESTDPKQVYLDRPFVYMLIDCENKIPFFIGTVTEV